METIKIFSLFSGIGAFEKALDKLKQKNIIEYEIKGYSETDKYASKAYSIIHNIKETMNYGDITKIVETKVPDCDLITYGFPCQDISVAGNQKGIVEGETRSGLLFDALRIIKHKQPKYAIAENVRNLVGKKFIGDFNSLLEELDSYGYNNYWQVLNAKDYGIPQNRERVFIVSIRKDVDDGKFEFPKPYDGGLRLKDLLEDEVEEKYYIDNERINILLNNLKDKEMLPYRLVCEQRTDEGLRFFKGGVVGTLRTIDSCGDKRVLEPNELVHTKYKIRKLTPKECWRLMGFDDKDHDKVKETGISDAQRYKMAGNSIVVNVIEKILENLIENVL